MADNRTRIPHRKFQLKPLPREDFTTRADKPEGTDVKNRGYHPGSNYTADEVQFLQAIDRFRRQTGRKFLSAVDHLRVALALGYRLPEQPDTPPRPTND